MLFFISGNYFKKSTFFKINFWNTILSDCQIVLIQIQDCNFVWPDLGQYCLQWLASEDNSRQELIGVTLFKI